MDNFTNKSHYLKVKVYLFKQKQLNFDLYIHLDVAVTICRTKSPYQSQSRNKICQKQAEIEYIYHIFRKRRKSSYLWVNTVLPLSSTIMSSKKKIQEHWESHASSSYWLIPWTFGGTTLQSCRNQLWVWFIRTPQLVKIEVLRLNWWIKPVAFISPLV